MPNDNDAPSFSLNVEELEERASPLTMFEAWAYAMGYYSDETT